MTRFLVLAPSFNGAGGERVAASWAAALARSGWYVVGVSYGEAPRDMGFAHLPLSGNTHARRVLELRELLRSQRIDVLITVMTYCNLLGIAACTGTTTSVVITEHSVPSLLLAKEGRSGRLRLSAAKMLYRRADAAVGVSHAVLTDLIVSFRVSRTNAFFLRNAIDLPVNRPQALELSDVAPAALELVFVGRLLKHKGPDTFVDLLEHLENRSLPYSATIIGDGAEREPLQERVARSRSSARFLGWQECWWEHVSGRSILVVTSELEGYGNVLAEAAAAGLRVVASSQALGVADAMHAGLNGALALTNAPNDLLQAIQEVTADGIGDGDERFAVATRRLHEPDRAALALSEIAKRSLRCPRS